MIYLVTLVILLVILVTAASNTRTAQLKRMARALNLRYDKQVDSVLLPTSSAQVQFFKQDFHQFYHALTFRESNAFVRVCDDLIFSSPLDKKPLHTYTLVAAELTKDTLPPFVLKPRPQNQPCGTNLPPGLATRYTLSAPEGFAFPSVVIGFLNAHPTCYIECTETALVYCELNKVAVSQLQPLRFRALQLVKELITKTPSPVPTIQSAVPTAPLTEAELQAQILLKLHAGAQGPSHMAARTGGRYLYGFILLALLSGMLFVAWYALHHWVGK